MKASEERRSSKGDELKKKLELNSAQRKQEEADKEQERSKEFFLFCIALPWQENVA